VPLSCSLDDCSGQKVRPIALEERAVIAVARPHGPSPDDAGYWLRGESGALTKAIPHICWAGCMFPNEIMTRQKTWNDILGVMVKVRDAHGWRLLEGQSVPAVTLAKQLVDEGRLGRIFHYRAKFLQDWTISADLPQGGTGLWRLDANVAGSGVTGDLLAHCIDTAMWLNGPIDKVTAMTETFIKERSHTITGKVEKVTIDDASAFFARFHNGSLATFEATRYARGHKALYTLEINGANASIMWDLHDLHRLQYFDHSDEGRVRGWRLVHITDGDHPYMKHWWVPGLQIGYEHTLIHQAADFLEGLAGGKAATPTFREALATDRVTDAVLRSAEAGHWETVPQ
jgi:predicted dehydrogenase